MKHLLVIIVAATVFCACDSKRDAQTFRGQSKPLQVDGTLSKNNDLVVKIDGVTVVSDKVTFSTQDTFYFSKGNFQEKEVSVFCTISSFSLTTTFCTVSLDSKEIATLKFE